MAEIGRNYSIFRSGYGNYAFIVLQYVYLYTTKVFLSGVSIFGILSKPSSDVNGFKSERPVIVLSSKENAM